jgi:hypothetical protein
MATFNNWSLADIHCNAKGAKTCQLLDGAARVVYTSDVYCTVPFPPSTFDKDPAATRLNLELRVPPTLEAYFDEVDAWAVGYLTTHSERIFNKPLSVEQVKESYHPTLKRHGDYPCLLRAKFDTAGRRACKFWSVEQQKREAPEDWRSSEVRPQLHVSHLWIMGRECGLVCNIEALLVQEASLTCPFGDQSPWSA